MPATSEKRSAVSQLLRYGAEWLDISPELHQEAVAKYEEICAWLHDPPSGLADFEPDLYAQGSFRLGTVIRPVQHEDEYDIDLVCLLLIARDSVSKADLKKLVGDRLKAHSGYRKILYEGKRCWTLSFPGKFHMDILPAIPAPDHDDGYLLITDKELFRWQSSAPKPFSEWFYGRMRPVLHEAKRAYAKQIQASVEDVPDWRVKTPLQRAIQILKRHRDLYFHDDNENRPASIIITTLAAHAYGNETEVGAALDAITAGMPTHVRRDDDGEYVIPNPVNCEENIADRWRGKPSRPRRFFEWLAAVNKDLSDLSDVTGLDDITRRLEPALGKRLVESAAAAYGNELRKQREEGRLKVTAGTGALGSAGTSTVLPHTFFGA